MEWQQGEFTITDNPDVLDMDVIHGFLSESYWAKGIPRAIVEKSIRFSVCFGLLHNSKQIGFGRVITDRATFAYLADVFVISNYRGRGLGKWLVACIKSHPELQGLRRWLLATKDAHGLYQQNGFSLLQAPDVFMQINVPDIYLRRQ